MKITKYASHTCVRCKVLDKLLKQMGIEPDETIYTEDIDPEKLAREGIMSLPTLIFEDGDNKKTLSGAITSKDINNILTNE